MSEAYVEYLEKVLGLKNLIWPAVEPGVQLEPQPGANRLAILFIAEHAWSAPARELFEKMREAMKVPASQVQILFADQVTVPDLQVQALSAERVVCFSDRLFRQIAVDPEVKFQTYGPDQLLQKPALKKEAWAELQKVMKSLELV
jgi:hypothetical protein